MTVHQSILASIEAEMQVVAENEYAAVSRRLWAPLVMQVRKTSGRRAILAWLLSTAKIRDAGEVLGSFVPREAFTTLTEVPIRFATGALQMHEREVNDLNGGDGEGLDIAVEWAEHIAGAIAYHPQEQAARVLKLGHLAGDAGGFTGYDGLPLFHAAHPLHPYRPELGTFSNLLVAPIDVGVTFDVALGNLGTVYSAIGSIKMPHGESLRGLRPRALLVPPKLFPRAQQLTTAMGLVSAAGAPGMSSENPLGVVAPVLAPELAGFESETTYFVVAEQVSSSSLGGIIYVEREPFRIQYYGGARQSLEQARAAKVEWQVHGRNAIATGHPFMIFKVTAS
jgi:hypothetical protein